MRLLTMTCAGLAVLLLAFAVPVHAISEFDLIKPELLKFSIGLGYEYETGDYGTGEDIDTWRVPLLIEWSPHDRFSLAVEIPYVRQSRTGETILLGGAPAPTRPGHGNGKMSNGDPAETTTTTSETTDSESGLGDITVDASVVLLKEEGHSPRLLGLLYAKLPTADEDKGLGTGEFDWGGGLGIGKRFSNWSVYAEALYIEPGTSDRYDPDGYWEWLAALSYRPGGNLLPGLSLSGGTAPFDGADDPLEVKFRLGVITGEQTSLSLYVARGLSDGSPEWAAGIFGYFDF